MTAHQETVEWSARWQEVGLAIERQGKRFVNLRFMPMVRSAGIELEEVKLSPTGTAWAAPAWVELGLQLWENYEDTRANHGAWRRTVMESALFRLNKMGEHERLEALAGALAAQALTVGDEGEVWRPIEVLSGMTNDEIEKLFHGHYYGGDRGR